MNRFIAYSVVIIAVTIPAVLLARTLIDTDEDQLEHLISSVEQERFGALLGVETLDDGGFVVSTGSGAHQFSAAEVYEARALLDEVTGIDSAEHVRLRQQQVTVRDTQATMILNVEVDGGDYVALRVSMTFQGDRWLVERIRVMG